MPFGHIDRRRELLTAWERLCRSRGGAEHCTGADALFLVTALSNALRRASETPELGRAARTWGARFGTPVEALATLSMLRDALTGVAEEAEALPVPLTVLNRVFDHAALEAVDAASANLRSEARNDPLTGCANRRALDEDLAHAAASARRSNLDLAVAVVDLDGLKQINDTRGHAAGDAALIDLVVALRRALREADTLYRTGGDEFVVVAPFTDAAGARALMRRAERMGGPGFSWGVASLAGIAALDEGDTAVLMDAADTDLYERRRAARRAMVVASRKRTATAVASVAASVVVTASMAGLAVALDAGSTAPASSGVRPGTTASHVAPRWPDSTLGSPGAGGSQLASQTIGGGAGLPLGGGGSLGTSLMGLLETVVPPSALPAPTAPLGGIGASLGGGVITVSLTSPTVTGIGPVALASAPGPVAPGGTTATTATAAQSGRGPGGGGSNGGGNGGGSGGSGGGAGGASTGGEGGGKQTTTALVSTAPTAPTGGGHGPGGGKGGGPGGHGTH